MREHEGKWVCTFADMWWRTYEEHHWLLTNCFFNNRQEAIDAGKLALHSDKGKESKVFGCNIGNANSFCVARLSYAYPYLLYDNIEKHLRKNCDSFKSDVPIVLKMELEDAVNEVIKRWVRDNNLFENLYLFDNLEEVKI